MKYIIPFLVIMKYSSVNIDVYKFSKTIKFKFILYFEKPILNEPSIFPKHTKTYINTKQINTLLILEYVEYSLQLLVLLIHI